MNESRQCLDQEKGDLLAAFEMGLLSSEERKQFENHLLECAACQERLYEMSPYLAAVLEDPAGAVSALDAATAAAPDAAAGLERDWDPFAEQSGWETRRAVSLPGAGILRRLGTTLEDLFTWRVWVPATVVAVLVLAVVFHFGGDSDGFRHFARLEPVPYVLLDTRAGETEAERLFSEGMTRYVAGRYGEAADLLAESVALQDAELPGGASDQARFYLGLSLLLRGDAAAAREPLARAGGSPVPAVAERAHWFLAQAYLLQEDPRAAIGPLEALADSGLVYSGRATEQLTELRRALAEQGTEPQ